VEHDIQMMIGKGETQNTMLMIYKNQTTK